MPSLKNGMAMCRQRPGTANGHCFISLEDETGIANLFVPMPAVTLPCQRGLTISTEHPTIKKRNQQSEKNRGGTA
jgi:hypothetical protein